MTPHMRRNHRTVGSCAQMCSNPFRDHIGFQRHLVWLLPYTNKPDRPLNQLEALKPSDAYTSQWVGPSSVQTMACLVISLTLTYNSLERRKYFSMKLYSKFKEEIRCKSHVQNVSHFVPASMIQGEPFELHVNWREMFRWVIMSFMLIVMYIYSGSRTSDSRGLFYWHGLTLIPAWISNYIHYKVWDQINYQFPN